MSIKPVIKRDNRLDDRWCHPEGRGGNNWRLPGLSNSYYEYEKMSLEEYLQHRKNTREFLLENYMSSESDKKKQRGTWAFYKAPGCVEEPDVEVDVCVRTPSDIKEGEKLPCVFDIQGGGWYEGGTYEYFMPTIEDISTKQHAVVVSLCYRSLMQVTGYEMLNDCHAAYQWVLDNADMLHVDKDRIVIRGFSAGGTLAVGLGFRLKRYGIRPQGVVAGFAPLDDVYLCTSGKISFFNEKENYFEAVDSEFVRMLMKRFMGEYFADPCAPPELMPSRATVEDCKGYPPIWMSIAEMDCSRDGNLDFARKLHEAGVFADYHVWGACNHNTCDPNTPLGKEVSLEDHRALRYALAYNFDRSWANEK